MAAMGLLEVDILLADFGGFSATLGAAGFSAFSSGSRAGAGATASLGGSAGFCSGFGGGATSIIGAGCLGAGFVDGSIDVVIVALIEAENPLLFPDEPFCG